MDTFTACMIIEGVEEAEDYEILEAWQYLIDTGVVWTLQGFYGRTARSLIEQGECYLPNAEEILAR
jgi:hypothetical protein